MQISVFTIIWDLGKFVNKKMRWVQGFARAVVVRVWGEIWRMGDRKTASGGRQLEGMGVEEDNGQMCCGGFVGTPESKTVCILA